MRRLLHGLRTPHLSYPINLDHDGRILGHHKSVLNVHKKAMRFGGFYETQTESEDMSKAAR